MRYVGVDLETLRSGYYYGILVEVGSLINTYNNCYERYKRKHNYYVRRMGISLTNFYSDFYENYRSIVILCRS